ncbi:cystathionine beta-synthase [Amycolatopsis sp. NBRC 101858]|uniref:PLP-dependent cysteine synthase family protein n=1 Tax=Amycolatopsis sp. NBRC 101858 TaxID=3032200 RepID=UPI0024A38A94|nr:pyridoxal-phosphate dependent enzyme [Amycolatopsis sp. NBRC 101858]GLY43125.1 cystathionine beta-synthase [Amycolatopsis sp. NBRC 101858]
MASGEVDAFDSVLDAIGGTPLIRLARIAPRVYVKAEFLNPGGSVKDRAALAMVLAAERSGALPPGGLIVEGTSGNTGIGLAIVAAQRGYRLTVVVPDKTSAEKTAILRAYGAEVVVTPGAVAREDPAHVRQVARRLAAERGGWLADQYDNPANPAAHRETTGPEIWRQTRGRITHFVAGIGTGGTVSGAGAYLKEVSGGRVRVVGADPEHSVYSGGDGSPYLVESIGHYRHPDTAEDLWPQSYHRDVLDRVEAVGDRESILTARRLAREEGLLLGASAGTAVAVALRLAAEAGPDDVIVVVVPDSGRSYLSKYYDDDWVLRLGFPVEQAGGPTVSDVIGPLPPAPPGLPATASVGEALADGHPATLRPVGPRASGPPSVAEVTGTLDVAELRLMLTAGVARPADPIAGYVTDPLPAIGIGESREAALARLGTHEAAWGLVDGRVAGTIHKGQLES